MLANDFKECERRRRSHQRQYDRIKMKKGLRPFSELEFWNNKLERFRNDVDASFDKLLAQYDRCFDSPVLSESLSFCGWSGSASSDISLQRGSDVKQQVPRLKVPVAKKMDDIEPLLAAKLAFDQDLASLVPLPSDDGCFHHSISQEQTHVLLPMKNEKRDQKRRGRRPVPFFSRPAHPSRMLTVIHCLRRGIFSWKDIRDEWAFNKSQSERQLLLDMQVEQIASCFEHLETELTSKFSTSQSELQHLFQHMQHLRDSDFQQLQEERQCKFEQEEDRRNREATAQNEYHQAQQRERARGLEKHLELATTDMDLFIRMNEEVVPAWDKRFSIVLEYHREEYKKEAQWREKRFEVLLDNLRGGRSRMS
ncbi:hypothetical protein H0H93_016351 [Arthromyces matolae]|nr:hypothetical protein H0H93_016351 [Arthromyces matolae]